MNYLVIGLSNFGQALATRLTSMGHDVIATDPDMRRVEEYKDQITTTMQLSLTDRIAVNILPLNDINHVIVAINDSIGDSILAVSLLKQAGVTSLTAVATSIIHKTILESLGITDIIMPETYAADLYAIASESPEIKGIYPLTSNDFIIEYQIPSLYEGLTIQNSAIEETYNLKVVTVKRAVTHKNIIGTKTQSYDIVDINTSFKFEAGDRIVLLGSIDNINKFKRQK